MIARARFLAALREIRGIEIKYLWQRYRMFVLHTSPYQRFKFSALKGERGVKNGGPRLIRG